MKEAFQSCLLSQGCKTGLVQNCGRGRANPLEAVKPQRFVTKAKCTEKSLFTGGRAEKGGSCRKKGKENIQFLHFSPVTTGLQICSPTERVTLPREETSPPPPEPSSLPVNAAGSPAGAFKCLHHGRMRSRTGAASGRGKHLPSRASPRSPLRRHPPHLGRKGKAEGN